MKYLVAFVLIVALVGVASADVYTYYTGALNDGQVGRSNPSESFSDMYGGAGTIYYNTLASGTIFISAHGSASGNYTRIYRAAYRFDTSNLSDDCTIDGATLDIPGYGKSNTFTEAYNLGITGFSPTNTTGGTIIESDYQGKQSTLYSVSNLSYASIDINDRYGYNIWSLNTTAGKGAINKTGYTNLMMRFDRDIDNNPFTWGASKEAGFRSYTSADATRKPKLIITWTAGGGGDTTPPPSISNLANTTTCNSINWTFTNPGGDQNETMVYKNGVFFHNLTNSTSYDLWTGLYGWNSYEFASKTVDIAGNVNATWTNQTARASIICKLLNYIRLQNSCYQLVNT